MTSSMTALVSAFARAYHTEHSAAPVYRDPLARRLLVSVDDFAAVRAALCTKGSAEAMLMRRLREQIAEEAGAGKSGE